MNLPKYYEDPAVLHVGTEEPRSYYIPFSSCEDALLGEREMSDRVLFLNGVWGFRFYESVLDVPGDIGERLVSDSDIEVPSVWQMQGYDHHQYTNVRYPFPYDPPYVPLENPCGVYQRSFEVTDKGSDRFYLNFEGVDSCFYVFVNGSMAGYSQVSHATSEFEITDLLCEGDNDLTVVVLKWCDGSYLEDQDKLRMSGIFRDVYVLRRAASHVRDFIVRTEFGKSFSEAELLVELFASENGGRLPLTLTLIDPEGQVIETRSAKVKDRLKVRFSVKQPLLWNAENPVLYSLLIESGEEVIHQRIGFRKIEVRGGCVLLNGKPIRFKGVNRHDSDPFTGYTISKEQLMEDLVLMKEHNINAIRTSHYPNAPFMPELCSEFGFYVISESDLETHGTVTLCGDADWIDKYAILPCDERFKEAMIDRQRLNVCRDRNQASIVVWSLGNEAGYGPNLEEAARFVKKLDPSRLLHYERCHDHPSYYEADDSMMDLHSRMYAPIEEIDAYFEEKKDSRPYVLCEYIHAMGNGPGSAEEYYECMLRHPGFAGGFVWEWCDHAVYAGNTPDGRPKFLYGGDFGEDLHDGNFCMDGLVYPDRRVSESLLEYKEIIRPVRAKLYGKQEAGKARVRLTNQLDFTDLKDHVSLYYEVLSDGVVAESRVVQDIACAPRRSVTIELPYEKISKGDIHMNLYYIQKEDLLLTGSGHELGFDQLTVREEKRSLPEQKKAGKTGYDIYESGRRLYVETKDFCYVISKITGAFERMSYHNRELLKEPMEYSIWRAPTDNDRNLQRFWKEQGFDRAIPRVYKVRARVAEGLCRVEVSLCLAANALQKILNLEAVYIIGADGSVKLTVKARRHHELHTETEETADKEASSRYAEMKSAAKCLPRFGLRLKLPKNMDQASFYGYGPYESYEDKHEASFMARFETSARDNYTAYLKPQENGAHFHTLEAAVFDEAGRGLLALSEKPFSFSISPYSVEELSCKGHDFELEEAPWTEVFLDYRQHGIGSNSCGPLALSRYWLSEERMELSVQLIPLE